MKNRQQTSSVKIVTTKTAVVWSKVKNKNSSNNKNSNSSSRNVTIISKDIINNKNNTCSTSKITTTKTVSTRTVPIKQTIKQSTDQVIYHSTKQSVNQPVQYSDQSLPTRITESTIHPRGDYNEDFLLANAFSNRIVNKILCLRR